MRRQPLRTLAVALAISLTASSQAIAQESRIGAEFRREAEHLRDCASFKTIMGCAMTVATGHPVHLSFGSLAPGNGVALGAAFSTAFAPSESWRTTWSTDAVRTFGGSWRAGAYLKFIYTPSPAISIASPGDAGTRPADLAVRPHTVIDVYGQTTSLQDVGFYGLGDGSFESGRATFRMSQSIVGASVIAPVGRWSAVRPLNLALLGEVNGRFVTLRDGADSEVPTLQASYSEQHAPGLASQPGFLQFGGGFRLKPVITRYLQLNYRLETERFTAADAAYSFNRWTADLDHAVAIYGTSMAVDNRDTNTPNECRTAPGAESCPAISRDRRGTIRLRALYSSSSAGTGAAVPFYFMPTLGGSDINGHSALPSFNDYRFRGSELLLFRQSFEHSVWGPIGAWIQADQGRVSAPQYSATGNALRKSIAAGLTIRAGGFPMVVASYAVGGGEGRHFSITINTSLLGGASRPTLD